MDDYEVHLEVSKGPFRRVAELSVNSEVMDHMQGLGLNALQEAVSEVVLRMQVSIQEDEEDGTA